MNNYLRNRKVGQQIIEGPRSIFPPGLSGRWYEKDFSAISFDYRANVGQHVSLWSDSTMNREGEPMPSIIRFVHWHRENDLGRKFEATFPDVRVFLGYIADGADLLIEKALSKVYGSLSKIDFRKFQPGLDGQHCKTDHVDFDSSIEIFMRNGYQTFSHFTYDIEDDEFLLAIHDVRRALLKAVVEFDKHGWIERYNLSFSQDVFDWDFSLLNGG
ncbi:hypothetical protein [Flaviaesturariibacter amylovorans]|uniref:Uncharacterized protein n=1 Tax=Flaviaesturariibacter amylovorans TaxID=1084520 RepID=A0ABP8G485_9BACT